MDYVKRAAWGARTARPRTRVEDTARTAFMLHYSTGEELGRPDTAEWVREIQAFHMSDDPAHGWADIGYNFLVDAAGVMYEGRGWGYVGAHCPGWNTAAVGVCFLGDDDKGVRDVPPVARQTIRLLYETAVSRAGHGLRIMGHRDGKATTCPGDELYAFVQSNLSQGLAVDPPTPRKPAPRPSTPRSRPAQPPPWPFRWTQYMDYRRNNGEQLRRWQSRMATRGWTIAADGVYGPQTEAVVRAFQREKGLSVDGRIGPRTWAAAWTSRVT